MPSSSPRAGALEPERIRGGTGAAPHRHPGRRSIPGAVEELETAIFQIWIWCWFENPGGDNLAASFSTNWWDLCIYVIDVAAGDKIPRKGVLALPAPTCW